MYLRKIRGKSIGYVGPTRGLPIKSGLLVVTHPVPSLKWRK